MSKINAEKRKKIPKSEFGLPGERKYPMPDKNHAKNAKARASQMVKAGKLSEGSKEKIDAKANKVLGKKKDGMSHISAKRISDYAKSRRK